MSSPALQNLLRNLQRLLGKGEYVHTGLLAIGAFFTWLFFNYYFWALLSTYISVRVMKFLYIISKSFVVHRLMPETDISDLKDSWTVVTGGTDGIGKAYTLELARARGIRRFVLIGRKAERLAAITKELKKLVNAEVKEMVFDFEGGDWNEMKESLKGLDIGILINFAGLAPGMVGNLVEQEEGIASKILQVNTISCVKMTELVLPQMVEKDRGIIVNMSSMTGWRPLPYTSSYPASKAAISFFTDALTDEFRSTNVKIQCLVPLLVATSLASYDISEANDIFVVAPETFARQAVRAIGTFELICGCWQHDLQIALCALISPWIFKQLFVPFGMLRVHRQRVEAYQRRRN